MTENNQWFDIRIESLWNFQEALYIAEIENEYYWLLHHNDEHPDKFLYEDKIPKELYDAILAHEMKDREKLGTL
jgi:hypothetical protein